MKKSFLLILLFSCCYVGSLFAQATSDTQPLYYIVERNAAMHAEPDGSSEKVGNFSFREPVYLVKRVGLWSQVRTKDGQEGFVRNSTISNVWIRVSKSTQTIYVYEGTKLLKEIPADLGYNSFADKERRGSLRDRDHWRTPEGTFFVTKKNDRSQYYKAFVLNYPSREDAERGLKQGLITQEEYHAIARAEAMFETPPMNTALGGMIEIHGKGTGARNNWTQGCVAIPNEEMDDLWNLVKVGTPVLITQ